MVCFDASAAGSAARRRRKRMISVMVCALEINMISGPVSTFVRCV